jgi:hypothetical protein
VHEREGEGDKERGWRECDRKGWIDSGEGYMYERERREIVGGRGRERGRGEGVGGRERGREEGVERD